MAAGRQIALLQRGKDLVADVVLACHGGGAYLAPFVKEGDPGGEIPPALGQKAAGLLDEAMPVFFGGDELIDVADGVKDLVEMLEPFLDGPGFVQGDLDDGMELPDLEGL